MCAVGHGGGVGSKGFPLYMKQLGLARCTGWRKQKEALTQRNRPMQSIKVPISRATLRVTKSSEVPVIRA